MGGFRALGGDFCIVGFDILTGLVLVCCIFFCYKTALYDALGMRTGCSRLTSPLHRMNSHGSDCTHWPTALKNKTAHSYSTQPALSHAWNRENQFFLMLAWINYKKNISTSICYRAKKRQESCLDEENFRPQFHLPAFRSTVTPDSQADHLFLLQPHPTAAESNQRGWCATLSALTWMLLV